MRVPPSFRLSAHPDRAEQILSQVSASLEVMASEAARVSLLWIMADFGQFIEGSIVLLDEISRDIGPSTSAELRLAVLSAAMRLFFKDPANMKQILSRILRFEIDAELPLAKADTRDRALFYLRLLHYSPEVAERIVGQPSATGAGQAGKTPADEQFLDFFEFNSLSVVFQRPAVSFTTPLPPFSSMLQRPRSAGPIGRVAGTSAASAPAADPLAGPLLGEAMAPAAGVSAGAGGTGHLLDVMDFSAGGRAGGASASPEDLASQLLGLDFSSATSTSAVALSGSPRSPMDELFGLDTPPTMPAGAAIAAATAPSASSPGTSALTPAALELDSGSFRRAWRQFAQPGQARQVTLPAPGHAGTLSADQLSLLFEAALEEQAKLTTFASGTVAANGALRLLMPTPLW
ncbi:hypothetical protein H696_00187 [Fonticula alba]|uniref:Clathrin/coatomer adaptor adaptin-like N-terminal domain-containing protein n=1 Tax=Fonticula alba TaxID=691883 RepID=A0A058ZF92_FONAL|nr:hypothetical protein H696_00187 [Fonticula alba]KCV72603.1 hypothetical protein H696_00187 [Fonticula alba]|eukprot:XP_009492304.1 hypothetical protein H696_00187 [Fonticula alba]